MLDGTEVLQTVGLTLHAAKRALLTNLNVTIRAGQCWCVIGRNGAGKSTLLQTLAGLRDAHAGVVRLKGRSLPDWSLRALARERAFLSQARSEAFSYRVIESILTMRHPYHVSGYWDSDNDYDAAYRALQALDVADLAQRDIGTLSGGERQRVAIAAVIAQETPILLLDEPATALDLGHQVAVMNLISRLCNDQKKAVIMVCHDLTLARDVATHALLLMDGGHWHAGPVEQIMQAPLLSACVGHAIEAVQHGQRTIFIPEKAANDNQ